MGTSAPNPRWWTSRLAPGTHGLFGPVIRSWGPNLQFFFTGDLSPAEQSRARAAFVDWIEHSWSRPLLRVDPEFIAAAKSGHSVTRWSLPWLLHDSFVLVVFAGLLVSLAARPPAVRPRRAAPGGGSSRPPENGTSNRQRTVP